MMIVIDSNPLGNPELFQMVDDGRGSAITIPSFIISLADGKKLIEAIHEEEKWKKSEIEKNGKKNSTKEEEFEEWEKEWKVQKHKRKGWG